jgi:hypothetical protein
MSAMRSVHCSVLALLAAAWSSAALAQPATPAGAASDFRIFVRGAQIGTEDVSVTRTPGGTVISGSGRLNVPIDVVTNRCEMRYDAQWKPLEAMLDAIVHGQYTSLHTVFTDGTAATQIIQAGREPTTRTDKIGPVDVVLLNSFFGLYEGLAARLQTMKAGSELKAYILPQAEIAIQVSDVTDERIQTPARTIATKHYQLLFMNPGLPVQGDLWADETGRLLRLAIPAQSFELAREDVASVAARREAAPRAGDEQVRIAAYGVSLAGTISKPVPPKVEAAGLKAKPVPSKAGPPVRYPAVILVGGSGPTDRDELVFGIPIFAQVAGALADAGFLVLRYDKRGVGQSGGRADSATLEVYAEDARAAVSFLRNRKDVDRNRIAIAGHSEGGWTAMLAARKNKNVRALVLIATPGVTGAELVLAQQEHLLQGMKLSEAERQAKIDLQKKIQRAVLTGTGWEGIAPELQKQADTLWFHSFLAFDPAKVMRNVKQPILIVQGDLDRQIFAPQADRLAEMARARKAPAGKAVTVVHVPGINHLLVPATTGEYDEYARLTDKNVSKDLLSAITSWLQKTLPVDSRQ